MSRVSLSMRRFLRSFWLVALVPDGSLTLLLSVLAGAILFIVLLVVACIVRLICSLCGVPYLFILSVWCYMLIV